MPLYQNTHDSVGRTCNAEEIALKMVIKLSDIGITLQRRKGYIPEKKSLRRETRFVEQRPRSWRCFAIHIQDRTPGNASQRARSSRFVCVDQGVTSR